MTYSRALSLGILGRLAAHNPGPHFIRAFRQLGWLVCEIDESAPFIVGATTPTGRAASRLAEPLGRRALNDAILAARDASGFEIFLALKGSQVTSRTLQQLRARGTFLVNWFPDFDFSHAGFDEAAFASYDLVITTKSHQVDYLRTRFPAIEVSQVEHGYCNLLHRPVPGIAPDIDVIYVGNATQYKIDLISAAAERLPGVSFGIAGARWQDVAMPGNVRCFGQQIGDAMSAFIARGRTALGFHMGPHGPFGWSDTVSARSFEIPACKVPMIHIDNPDIRKWFEPAREIICFDEHSPGDLARKIERVLADPASARQLAEAGYRRAVPAYGYEARGEEMARLIEKAVCRAADREFAHVV